jgi:hypothetical protein
MKQGCEPLTHFCLPITINLICSVNEELHILYSSPSIIRQIRSRRMRWAGHVARMGEERKVCKILVGKPEGRRPLGRSRRRWESGIRVDLREFVWGSLSRSSWLRIGTGGGLL